MNSTAIVIDDDEDQASLLSEILEGLGKKVNAIGFNGKDAVKLFEKYHPDYVFLDIMMPEYDGFYAIDEIKKIDPEAKIIAITGDMTGDTHSKLGLLNISIIYKPFEIFTIGKIF